MSGVAIAGSCSFDDDRRTPERLADGSAVRAVPVELEGVEGSAVLTRVRVVRIPEVARHARAAECLHSRAAGARLWRVAVERVGVSARSLTAQEARGRGLVACDDSPGGRETGRPWCGGSYGRLYSGRLRDPRLSVLCSTGDRKPLGLLWVEPQPQTTYVAVEQAGFTEVYEVAAGLPVRVAATAGVDLERSSANLSLSEHDARGRLVRRYELHAAVAG